MAITSQDFKIGLNDTEKATMANQITAETLNKLIPAFSTSVAYTKGQYTMYSNALYRFTTDKSAGAWDSTKVESATLNDLIDDVNEAVASVNDKANVDGYYSSMSVGLSDNFNTNMTTEDTSPYNFRTSGDTLEIANQCKEKAIVGGSVVVNQLADIAENGSGTINAVTITATNHKISFNGTPNATGGRLSWGGIFRNEVELIQGHKYLVYMSAIIPDITFVFSPLDTSIYPFVLGNSSTIYTPNTTTTCKLGFNFGSTTTTYNDDSLYFMLVDLTQMFGSTIANYLATLETGQTGAGVAWFRKYFPKQYYAYNTGSFLNVKTTGKKVVGFNQWDISNTSNQYSTNCNYTSETIKNIYVDSRTSLSLAIQVGDSNGNVVRNISYTTSTIGNRNCYLFYSGTINEGEFISFNHNGSTQDIRLIRFINVIPNTTYCLSFEITSNHPDVVGGLVFKQPCINLHWDGERDGEYEPYEETTYPIEDVELRGIPKLDSNNELYFDGDVYHSDGVVDENYAEYTFTGNENWGYNTTGTKWIATVNVGATLNPTLETTDFRTNADIKVPYRNTTFNVDGFYVYGVAGGSNMYLQIRDSVNLPSTVNPNTIFTAGKKLYYKLEKTIVSEATPFTEVQNVSNWGTEEFLDNRDVPMPVGHITEYLPDLRAKLETAPESPEDDGYYVMKRDNGENSYSLLSTWLTVNGYIVPTSITGYDATKTQVLKNVEGVLTWVDEEV